MAISVRHLGSGSIAASATGDICGPVLTGKTAVVRSFRLVNTHASQSTTVNVVITSVSPGSPSGQPPVGTDRQVSPRNVAVPPGGGYIDDTEITLEANHKLKATVGSSGPVEFVVSGIERDV